jgi:hypothetical protein
MFLPSFKQKIYYLHFSSQSFDSAALPLREEYYGTCYSVDELP